MKPRELIELGLNEREAKTYLAALEAGNSTAFSIAKITKIPKTTTNDVLASLSKKGLVSSYSRKNRKYYAAADPQTFKEKISRQSELVDKLLPQMLGLYNTNPDKPKVRYYEGKEGLDLALNEFLKETDSILAIAAAQAALEAEPEYSKSIAKARVKYGVRVRSLYTDDKFGRELKSRDNKELRKTRLIRPKVPFTSMIWVWNKKVAFFSFKKSSSVFLIDDPEIAQMIRMMFESMWENEPEVS